MAKLLLQMVDYPFYKKVGSSVLTDKIEEEIQMSNRIISFVVLIVFINYINGCVVTKREKAFTDELKGTEKIIGIVSPNGEEIVFNKQGGKYLYLKDAITGTIEDGNEISFSFDLISEIRTSRAQPISRENLNDKSITEVIVPEGNLRGIVRFDDKGGRYNKTNDKVEGTSIGGKQIELSFDYFLEVRISQPEIISKEEITTEAKHIAEIVLENGDVKTFDANGGSFKVGKHAIIGTTEMGRNLEIEMDKILFVQVEKVDGAKTLFATVGVIAIGVLLIFGIALLLKESCPFVYSFDGEKYIFDAEPLGGAIAKGLQKTDYSRLEYLKAVDGKYHLKFKNEVEETQYLDEVKLLVVDHDPGTEVTPDLSGVMHVVQKPIPPISALDENGMDLTNFIEKQDGVAWQTHFPTDDSYKGKDLRHHLTFEFPKPINVKSAKLLVNAGTGLWGSNMIREMLQLRGDKVDNWYKAVNNGEYELFELYKFIEREELYILGIQVQQGDSWVPSGFIPGSGPFVTEDRVIHLDLNKVEGDILKIRVNPPFGFWTIDYIGIEYGEYPAPIVDELSIDLAEDQYGKVISEFMNMRDDSYQEMPELGDWFNVSFNEPAEQEGMKRSLFLKTTGYYELHLPKDKPEQTELIQKMHTTPGAIIEYAMDEYLKWRTHLLSSK